MAVNRRGFFASLFAPLLARLTTTTLSAADPADGWTVVVETGPAYQAATPRLTRLVTPNVAETRGWKPGEKIWIADWFEMPVQKCSSGVPRPIRPGMASSLLPRFIATETVQADAAGCATLHFHPPIIPSGYYQNVERAPEPGARIWHGEALVQKLRAEILGDRMTNRFDVYYGMGAMAPELACRIEIEPDPYFGLPRPDRIEYLRKRGPLPLPA
jgi:hypothetical protein